jgi:hypothetical protein
MSMGALLYSTGLITSHLTREGAHMPNSTEAGDAMRDARKPGAKGVQQSAEHEASSAALECSQTAKEARRRGRAATKPVVYLPSILASWVVMGALL